MIPWLESAKPRFHRSNWRCTEPNGLLCAGGDLSPQRILSAYQSRHFPVVREAANRSCGGARIRVWFFTRRTSSISRSLRKTPACTVAYEVRLDSDFPAVIRACAESRRATASMAPGFHRRDAVTPTARWHELGFRALGRNVG
jgi:leucyl/phenylalanyl-tRNA--protein transferase